MHSCTCDWNGEASIPHRVWCDLEIRAVPAFPPRGYGIGRRFESISPAWGNAVELMIWRELRRHGAFAEEIAEWSRDGWFPWLRGRDELWNVLPERFQLMGDRATDWGKPQIVMRLPDLESDKDLPLIPHVDAGDWAVIIGIAVTPYSLAVWPGSHDTGQPWGDPVSIALQPGDVIAMAPKLAHSGVLNYSPRPRIAVYWRLRRT